MGTGTHRGHGGTVARGHGGSCTAWSWYPKDEIVRDTGSRTIATNLSQGRLLNVGRTRRLKTTTARGRGDPKRSNVELVLHVPAGREHHPGDHPGHQIGLGLGICFDGCASDIPTPPALRANSRAGGRWRSGRAGAGRTPPQKKEKGIFQEGESGSSSGGMNGA